MVGVEGPPTQHQLQSAALFCRPGRPSSGAWGPRQRGPAGVSPQPWGRPSEMLLRGCPGICQRLQGGLWTCEPWASTHRPQLRAGQAPPTTGQPGTGQSSAPEGQGLLPGPRARRNWSEKAGSGRALLPLTPGRAAKPATGPVCCSVTWGRGRVPWAVEFRQGPEQKNVPWSLPTELAHLPTQLPAGRGLVPATEGT